MKQLEQQQQIYLFKWASTMEQKYQCLKYMFHIPNGGARNKITGRNLKLAGVKKGVPDICLPVAKGKYHALYIEMKSEKGEISIDQSEFIMVLRGNGYRVDICFSWNQAAQTI